MKDANGRFSFESMSTLKITANFRLRSREYSLQRNRLIRFLFYKLKSYHLLYRTFSRGENTILNRLIACYLLIIILHVYIFIFNDYIIYYTYYIIYNDYIIYIMINNDYTGRVCVCMLSYVQFFERPHGLQSTRLFCPWDSPGKNTGEG